MDKDKVEGAIDDTTGRVKRQVGEWTGDTSAQVEGATQQVKGKLVKAWGGMKDAARDAANRQERDGDVAVERQDLHDRNEGDRHRP